MKEVKYSLKEIITHCKNYGFIFASSEIYEGINSIYDYGPNGIALKNNLKKYWWKSMIQMNNEIVGLDSAILTHEKIWRASGHLEQFNDIMIDNKDSKLRYRIDELIDIKIQDFDNDINKAQTLKRDIDECISKKDLSKLFELIKHYNILDPISKTSNWTKPKIMNMMFYTNINTDINSNNNVYLRPETAQGIFINFNNIVKSNNLSIPFGVAQIGKAFRNEIIARQFIMRMKEFEQMELQYFVIPKDNKYWYENWQKRRLQWHFNLLNKSKIKIKNHDQKSHYELEGSDIEYLFPFGFKEIEGIHLRGDYDLKRHQRCSKQNIKVFDKKNNTYYIPHVVETSIGVDRLFLSILFDSFVIENINNKQRFLLKLNPMLSPIKVAIMPLIQKNELINISINIFHDIKFYTEAKYFIKNSIGKRYRKQDAIGTPYCITVDNNTLNDESVTLRYRDSMQQERIKINYVKEKILSLLNDNELMNF
ncbi:MAG: glycine--tRNA ligase [Bacteroides sp.]|nr:MAG: glycine--tRNA ligase [Bacteroides sp.]